MEQDIKGEINKILVLLKSNNLFLGTERTEEGVDCTRVSISVFFFPLSLLQCVEWFLGSA